MSKQRKRKRKTPIGRDALRDVQERALPRSSQYSAEKKKRKELNSDRLDQASRRAATSSGATRTRNHRNHLIALSDLEVNWKTFTIIIAILGAAIVYALWPTLAWAEQAWRIEPDYSHGYLVLATHRHFSGTPPKV